MKCGTFRSVTKETWFQRHAGHPTEEVDEVMNQMRIRGIRCIPCNKTIVTEARPVKP